MPSPCCLLRFACGSRKSRCYLWGNVADKTMWTECLWRTQELAALLFVHGGPRRCERDKIYGSSPLRLFEMWIAHKSLDWFLELKLLRVKGQRWTRERCGRRSRMKQGQPRGSGLWWGCVSSCSRLLRLSVSGWEPGTTRGWKERRENNVTCASYMDFESKSNAGGSKQS